MDLTQGSEIESPAGRRAHRQTGTIPSINRSTEEPGRVKPSYELNPPLDSQSISYSPALRITAEELPMIELDKYQVDDNEPSETTTMRPTPITIEETTPIVDIKENAIEETTILPEITDKKIGLKSARSLPEERFRMWPGTITPDAEASQNGVRTPGGLSLSGQDAIVQWNDIQKRSGTPPVFDANKWFEAVRAYQNEKNAWANRATAEPTRNPRPFNPGSDNGQNQFLVVNNRGVVIPNSVQFPDLVKAAAYPQLQTYRYPQNSRNIQEILRYVTTPSNTNRIRHNQWPTAVKKAAKVSGMYLDNYATSTYASGRPEAAYLAGTTGTSQGGKPLNGHAYISDPFHPYKPADPTEINHLADNAGYIEDLPTQYVYPTKLTKTQFRNQYGSGGKQTQYTTAIFKPFGNQDQVSTSSANVDALMQYLPQQKRVLPPLSVMLEIYPVANEDPRTVPFRGTATSNAFRRPGNALSLLQKEPAVRRPSSTAVDASVASSNVPVLTTQTLQFQPQVQQQQVQPAFGMTLSGLPTLPGMGQTESKHTAPRMVVHLNFYPKKNPFPVVPRLRDPSEELPTELSDQGDTLTAGVYADYPQRRQLATNGVRRPNKDDNVHTAKENYFPSHSVVQAEFDASSLASVLPKDVLQRFSDFLRVAAADSDHQNNYEMNHDTNEDYGPDANEDREDHEISDEHDNEDEDSDEDDEDDEEEGRVVPYPEELRRDHLRRHPPMMRHPETARVPFHKLWRTGGNVSWPDVQYDYENEEEEGIGEIKGRAVGDASLKLKIMPGKTKVIAVKEDVNEGVKTSTTTERPEVRKDSYKPRRRKIIESSPKNHRMQ